MSGVDPVAVVRDFVAAWNARDRVAIRAALHPEIHCTGASYPPAKGPDETMALCEPFLVAEEIDWQIVNCARNGHVVFTERVDRFRFVGKPWLVIPAAGVYEVDTQGLITRWHDYFDTAGLAEAMG